VVRRRAVERDKLDVAGECCLAAMSGEARHVRNHPRIVKQVQHLVERGAPARRRAPAR
jgi:hypothetical protein